ncbi:MAG: hypothetical protein M3139_02795 [Bacteroidota bacterium]|nr:hypothetical protein [Bacteroidota bacterium]
MDTVYDAPVTTGIDSTLFVKNQTLLWQVNDSAGFKLSKPKNRGIDTMSASNVVDLVNVNYDSIHIDYIKTSHDTVYIGIPHSERLTEKSGDTGAENFMASTVYSLTEVKGIRFVNFEFKGGDHAMPGVYTRDDFKNFR